MPQPSSPIAETLRDLASALERAGVRWYVFGAQAAIAYGSTRVTKDIDVTVEPPSAGTHVLLGELRRSSLEPRVEDVDGFLAKTRVVPLVHAGSGVPVDVVLAGPGLEAIFLRRARRLRIVGVDVQVASPEDIVAMKLLAGRPHDLEDAAAVLRAQPSLDLSTVRSTLELLEDALDQSDLLPALDGLLARVRGG